MLYANWEVGSCCVRVGDGNGGEALCLFVAYEGQVWRADLRATFLFFFFFKQKTAYEIDCDWSSDVCSPISSHSQISYAVFCLDRKSTRLNSSHSQISYAVFCLKKKKKQKYVNKNYTILKHNNYKLLSYAAK